MRFALDQNFPQPIIDALDEFMVEAELVALAAIEPRLSDLDDWQVLLALHLHEDPWDGLITTDSGILSLPRELSVLLQTHLTLVVADAAGHDPLKATGLLLTYLPWIAHHSDPSISQLWVLRARNQPHMDPWERLATIAERQEVEVTVLYDDSKLSREELQTNPLD